MAQLGFLNSESFPVAVGHPVDHPADDSSLQLFE